MVECVFEMVENIVRIGEKSTECWCQPSTVGCLIEDKKSKSKKGHNSAKRMHFEFSPLIVSMDFSLDGEHILGVSSKYLQ